MATVSEQWRDYQTMVMMGRVDRLMEHALIKWAQGDRKFFYALQREAGMDFPGNIYLAVLREKLHEVSNGIHPE